MPHSHILVQGREVIISGANERDIGVYQCIAANSLGEAQGASYLTIRGKALFEQKLSQDFFQGR